MACYPAEEVLWFVLQEIALLVLLFITEVSGMKLTSLLYKLARISRDIEVASSGNPKKIARRAKNKVLGRALRRLW